MKLYITEYSTSLSVVFKNENMIVLSFSNFQHSFLVMCDIKHPVTNILREIQTFKSIIACIVCVAIVHVFHNKEICYSIMTWLLTA